jgi:hypothetical protein
MSSGPEIWQRLVQRLRQQFAWSDSPEVLRRQSTVGIIGGIVLFVIGLGCTGSAWHDYRTLGTAPQELTAEQAVPSPDAVTDDARWVTLTGPLVFDCANSLDHTLNGTVMDRIFIASDSEKGRYFYVTLKHHQACESLAQPISGILKRADAGLPAWSKDKGFPIPDSKYPLMEFEVGAGPGTQRTLVYIGCSLALVSAVIVAAFIRVRPNA